ncbi:hypothetical protein F2Q70_00016856 [Brassica cretica]|uniref:Uncharacterized protein n=1 Tax=Brassica cretica TaxID=69181 RepID=A0A8S9HY45_BRACR|nr:hypothetical protein F2Q70_00016856 [Brassica cretica]
MAHIILELFLIGHTFNLLSTLLSHFHRSISHLSSSLSFITTTTTLPSAIAPIRYLTTIISSQIRRQHHRRLVIITTQLSDFVLSNLRKKHEALTSGSAFTKSKSIDSGYEDVVWRWQRKLGVVVELEPSKNKKRKALETVDEALVTFCGVFDGWSFRSSCCLSDRYIACEVAVFLSCLRYIESSTMSCVELAKTRGRELKQIFLWWGQQTHSGSSSVHWT